MPFGLDDSLWHSLLRGVALADYHLLLGAGASRGALDRYGKSLPGAPDLAVELANVFKVPTEAGEISLPRAYEAAKRRRDESGRTVYQYLTDRFTECHPPEWCKTLSSNRWAQIWTLNIDDVVRQAYGRWIGSRTQQLQPVAWTDTYRLPRQNEVLLVHLHGMVDPTRPTGREPELVFDITEYLKAVDRRHAWHHTFADLFSTKPFIVVGARLADEFDLAAIVRRGNQSLKLEGRPSVVVLREISQLQREEFEEWGLIPVQADAGSFFEALAAGLPKFEQELAMTTPGSPKSLSREAVSFLQQFVWLKVDQHDHADPKHDFYAGHDPKWDDVLHDRDAEFEIVDHLAGAVIQAGLETQSVYCIWGQRFSGKSTALLRIARRLIAAGLDVFFFRGEAKLDTDAVLWWLGLSSRAALMVDGLADSAPEIGELALRCKERGIGLSVIGTERGGLSAGWHVGRIERLYSTIAAEFLHAGKEFEMDRLTDGDIDRLLDKLTTARRLGRISGLSLGDQRHYFKREARRQLFAGMAGLESGGGFRERLRNQYDSIAGEEYRQAYMFCCLSYALGYPLPLSILSAASGVSSADLVRATSTGGQLVDVIQLDRRGAKPRHRTLASMMIEMSDREVVFDLSVSLARQLAPYINPMTISQRTLPYQIARELMDHQVVQGWVGKGRVDKWYEDLVPSYDWNARFWEQRALAETTSGQFDRAESYAEHAVKLHRDPFTLNTLGTVLLRKAIEWCEPGSASSWDYYWRGVRYLRDSRTLAGEYQHPYVTFFEIHASVSEPDPSECTA